MKARLNRVLKFAAYPLFYLLCLGLFGYLCFPFDALKGRIISEFARMQKKPARPGSPRAKEASIRLEIDELDGHWFTGLELEGARLVFPPDDAEVRKYQIEQKRKASKPRKPNGGDAKDGAAAEEEDKPPQPSVIAIDRATIRVRLLPLLTGTVRIDFAVHAFGGEIHGSAPYGKDAGDLEVDFDDLQLADVGPLRGAVGLPVLGMLNGALRLTPKEGRFSKSSGSLDLSIQNVVVGDGKSKLQGIMLPAAHLGDLAIGATAKEGQLKIAELSAIGRDLELQGEGRIRIREPWNNSNAEIYLKFRFTDAYRDRNDMTRGLLGKPGSKVPGALDLDKKVRRAKREDGFYGWRVHGRLAKIRFDPQATKNRPRRPTAPKKGATGASSRKGLKLPTPKRPITRPRKEPAQPRPARPRAPRPDTPRPPTDNAPGPEDNAPHVTPEPDVDETGEPEEAAESAR